MSEEEKKKAREREEAGTPGDAEATLSDDAASRQFFGVDPDAVIPDKIAADTTPGAKPYDSPSVEFFGKHLEEFVSQPDDVTPEDERGEDDGGEGEPEE